MYKSPSPTLNPSTSTFHFKKYPFYREQSEAQTGDRLNPDPYPQWCFGMGIWKLGSLAWGQLLLPRCRTAGRRVGGVGIVGNSPSGFSVTSQVCLEFLNMQNKGKEILLSSVSFSSWFFFFHWFRHSFFWASQNKGEEGLRSVFKELTAQGPVGECCLSVKTYPGWFRVKRRSLLLCLALISIRDESRKLIKLTFLPPVL